MLGASGLQISLNYTSVARRLERKVHIGRVHLHRGVVAVHMRKVMTSAASASSLGKGSRKGGSRKGEGEGGSPSNC